MIADENTAYSFLKETDRLNLCDIAWFLKGLNTSGNSPFCSDHDETLKRVIRVISIKTDNDKAGNTK